MTPDAHPFGLPVHLTASRGLDSERWLSSVSLDV